MAVVIDRVMNMVRDEIQKKPDITSQELFERAKKLDRGVRGLTPRQFNATYPLQVRRSLAPKRPRARRAPRKMGAGRDHVRGVLLDFARTVAGAEDPGQLVDVIGNLDRWIERITTEPSDSDPARRRSRA